MIIARTAFFIVALSVSATAQDIDLAQLKIDKIGLDVSRLLPRSLPETCPRIDLVSVTQDLTAVNVNGYTIGHANGLTLPGLQGPLSINGHGMTLKVKNGVSPVIDCVHGIDITFDGSDGKLEVQGMPVAHFDRFVWTKQNLDELVRKGRVINRIAAVSIYESDAGLTGYVSSGPDRPQPSDGGGGGPKSGGNSPTDNPFNPPKGPTCCRGGA